MYKSYSFPVGYIVISQKNKYGTSIIPRSNIDSFLNEKLYSSISENINNLKSILYNSNNNYISHENKDNNKKDIIIKNIPIPKSTKNNNKINKEKEENNSIIKRNNYDRDDFFENEKKSNNNHSKNKISIIDILR